MRGRTEGPHFTSQIMVNVCIKGVMNGSPKRDRNRFGRTNPVKISIGPSASYIATCDDVRCPHVSSDCDEFYIVL